MSKTTPDPINWNYSHTEAMMLSKITQRAMEAGIERDRMSIQMDLAAAHCNGCRLDLERLLAFPDFDFVHDIVGVINHINRRTGKLERCFVPRCASQEAAQ